MCTVSIIPLAEPGAYRLVTSRDEHRERARGLPPRWHEARAGAGPLRRAVWPLDGAAGGTWVASGEHGLTLAILNMNPWPEGGAPARSFRATSRGLIIPRLIASPDVESAADAALAMDAREFLPFRLVAVGPGSRPGLAEVFECRWDGRCTSVVRHGASPVCFASSGLGDRLVEPRLALFETMVVARGATAEAQDAFHAHAWPDRLPISVMMSRADARTVSVTRVEARPAEGRGWRIDMDYRAIPELSVAVRAGQPASL